MASSQAGSGSPRKSAAKSDSAAQEEFNVSHFITEEIEMPWTQLALDIDLKQGQIRTINALHRQNLVEQFRANPPHVIELTTVLDQGM